MRLGPDQRDNRPGRGANRSTTCDKELEQENAKLKRLLAEAELDKAALKDTERPHSTLGNRSWRVSLWTSCPICQ
jgi:hypothetical protein